MTRVRPKRPTPAELLELALHATVEAVRWRQAFAALPTTAGPSLRNKVLRIAGEWEDEAFATANRVRVMLGGVALPDPADPPPVRPDD